jgi:hypothetical protein
MSREELHALQKFFNENLVKGFILASSLPVEFTVLLVKKPNGCYESTP